MLILAACAVGCTHPPPSSERPVQVVGRDEITDVYPGLTFASVRDVVSGTDGFWVLDRSPPYLTFAGPGDPPRVIRFGDRGDGPAELQLPVAVQATAAGVTVWDERLGKLVDYSTDGDLIRVSALGDDRSGWIRPDMTEVSHLNPWRVRRLGDGVVYARFASGVRHATDFGLGALVKASADLGTRRILISYADLLPRDESALGQFPAMPLWDACGQALAVWDPAGARVLWLDDDGTEEASEPLIAVGEVPTLTGIERYLRLMARQELGPSAEAAGIDFRDQARRVRPDFGERATPFVDLRCGADGSVWLQRFDLEQDALGGADSWIVVARGEQLREIRFPEGFRPRVFRTDAVIGVQMNREGEHLAVWRRIVRSTQ